MRRDRITINLCLYKSEILDDKILKLLIDYSDNNFDVNLVGYGNFNSKKIKKTNPTNFSSIVKRVNYREITLYFGGEPGVNDDWDILIDINDKVLSFIYDSKFELKPYQAVTELLQLIELKSESFGFLNFIPFHNMPDCYNNGVVGNDWPRHDMEKMRSWRIHFNRHDGKYQPGDLRDVYPYNILSDLHLNRDVHGQTLETWIKSDPRHGTLEKITDTHWLWSIDEKDIPHAQEVLSSANLLVAYWELGK